MVGAAPWQFYVSPDGFSVGVVSPSIPHSAGGGTQPPSGESLQTPRLRRIGLGVFIPYVCTTLLPPLLFFAEVTLKQLQSHGKDFSSLAYI
ncbi:MAG: hypothetical protein HYW37_01350 [Candidatus Colwellbacteria bacterium]|nr:hypothetical protein [Candidatus Colwellbacteria bacterium]